MTEKSTYAQIIKSSSIMGGVAGFALILGMVRIKFAAVLIGSIGVGILSNFNAILGLFGALSGLGIQSSAVREIAVVAAKNDVRGIARIVLSLRRVCWLSGGFGMIALVLMSAELSRWTFGSEDYAWDIAVLGIVILITNIQSGQMALIQGMRRMGDLAKTQMIGAFVVTFIAIGFYLWLGVRGIVPALLLMAVSQLFISWWTAKKIEIPVVKMSWIESFSEASGMLRLGVAMMWSGFLGSGVIYVMNALITEQINVQSVGIYSAALSLSAVFVNFILSAMGADYYPRLSGVAHDSKAINQLVNEQTEIGILLAAPCVMFCMVLAPLLIHLFYSPEFSPAATVLQWLVLGCLGKVISWPMGYIMLALNKARLFLLYEAGAHFLNLFLMFLGLRIFGLEGMAISFCALYLINIAATFYVARYLTSFQWTSCSKRLIISMLLLSIIVFCIARLWPSIPAVVVNLLISTIVAIISLRGLIKRLGKSNRIIINFMRIPGIQKIIGINPRKIS